METECVKQIKKISRTVVNRDVIVLYMLAEKYKLSFLSLLALYEIYSRDIFLFFYVLTGEDNSFMGKTSEDIDFLSDSIKLPKESNLKLMFTKAKKISDALRRGSDAGLTSITLPWYNSLKKYCLKSEVSNDCYINFYTEILDKEGQEKPKSQKRVVSKKKEKELEKEAVPV